MDKATIVLIVSWSFFILTGLVVLIRKDRGKPWACFYLAFVLQVFLSFITGLFLSMTASGGGSCKVPVAHRILIPFVTWIYNTGGFTIQYLYRSSIDFVMNISGNDARYGEYYIFLVVLQSVALSFFIGARWYKTKRYCDPVALMAIMIFFINSLFNVQWFLIGIR